MELLSGAPIKTIVADVTPGGGKSKMPVILASMLISKIADKIIWVVPRNSLKYQGEEEFVDPRFPTDKRMRATNGNDSNPDRGSDGYITTYQAIGINPGPHVDYCRGYRTILFLDEPHHIKDDSSWEDATRPLIDAAVLVVFASGTLSRGDGQKIAYLDYEGEHVADYNTRETRYIRYSRSQAIQDGAIVPVYGRTIDGAAEWISEEGIHRKVESIKRSGGDRAAAVYTALRTGYAEHLLNATIEDWIKMRAEYEPAKLLVVAPDIETAKKYHGMLARNYLAEIATSEDSPAARRVIAEYKRGAFPVLVTVAMAYEGLSVPAITHIACLTQIRSVPWLEQCFARANRVAPGKKYGVVYGPADHLFLQAIRMIEAEQRPGLKDPDERATKPENPVELVEGMAAPTIEPLWSSALGPAAETIPAPVPPSEMERILIDNIRAIKRSILADKHSGSLQSTERLMGLRIRQVADKPLEDMGVEELTAVWIMLREKYVTV